MNIAFEIDSAKDGEGHSVPSYYRGRTTSEGSQEGMKAAGGGGLAAFNDSTHSLSSGGNNHAMEGGLSIEGRHLKVGKDSLHHHPQKRGSNGSNSSSFSGSQLPGDHPNYEAFLLKLDEQQNGATSSSSFGKQAKSPSHSHSGQGQRARGRSSGEGEEEDFRYILGANGTTTDHPFSDVLEDEGHAREATEPFNPSESTASLAALKASKGLKLKSVSYFNTTNASDLYHQSNVKPSGKGKKKDGKGKSLKIPLIPPFSTSHLLRFQKEQENPFLMVSPAVAYESPSVYDDDSSTDSVKIIDGPLVSASISDFPQLLSTTQDSRKDCRFSSHSYDNSETSSLSDRAIHRKNRSPGRKDPYSSFSAKENDPLRPQVVNAFKHSKELQQKRIVTPISESYTNDHLMNHLESFLAVSRDEKAKNPTLEPLQKRYSVLIPSREEVKYKSTESLDKLKQQQRQQMRKEDEGFEDEGFGNERDMSKSLSTSGSSTKRRQQRLGTATSSLVLPSSTSLSSLKQRKSHFRSRTPSAATTVSITNFIDFKPASLQLRDEKNFYQYFNNPLISSSQGKKRKSKLPPKVDNIVYDRKAALFSSQKARAVHAKEASPVISVTATADVKDSSSILSEQTSTAEEAKGIPFKMNDSVFTAEDLSKHPPPLELQLSTLEEQQEGKFTSIDNSLELKSCHLNEESSSLLFEHSSSVLHPSTGAILQQIGKSYSTLKLPSIHSPSFTAPPSSLMVTALPDSSYSPPHEMVYPAIHEEFYHNTSLNVDPTLLDSMRRQQYEYSYQLSDIKTMIQTHKKKAFGKLQFPSRSPIQSATRDTRTFLTIVGSDSHVPSSLLAAETIETTEENPLVTTAATNTQPETSFTETINTQLLPLQFDTASSSCFSPLNANHLSTQPQTFPQREPPVSVGQSQKNSTVSTPYPSLLDPSSLIFPGNQRKPLPWLVSSSLAQSATLPVPTTAATPIVSKNTSSSKSSKSLQEYLQNETIQKDNLFNRSDRIAIWKEKIELLKLTHAIDPIKHKTTIRKQNRNRTAFEEYVKQLSC
jgi:hypothetical protein